MTNAERILGLLDSKLAARVELTLYGRAALLLGFERPEPDYALSRDVDAVLWLGQAEELNETTNFWSAVEDVNTELADRDLYISHFFTEDQVILMPDWRTRRIALRGDWQHLSLWRLGNSDLLLSKLMRYEPIDQADARFIVASAGLTRKEIEQALQAARLPDSDEVREQFSLASASLLESLATL